MLHIPEHKFKNGGLVPDGYKPPKLERGWWKCLKCGAVYESWSKPPMHFCK